jgi:hypothetical protein
MATGWKLTPECRARLLAQFPPRYATPDIDHVTLKSGEEARGAPVPEPAGHAEIIGRADDGAGVEAMVVAIDGSTERPDGGTWHVTWSLSPGREARESNDVIAEKGWKPVDPQPLELAPAKW